MKPKIYLSVPMTGTPDNGRSAADAQIAEIRRHFPEAEIVDPTSLPDVQHRCGCVELSGNFRGDDITCGGCGKSVSTLDYRATILRDIRLLLECDALWLSPGWEKSLGCVIESMAFAAAGAEYMQRHAEQAIKLALAEYRKIIFGPAHVQAWMAYTMLSEIARGAV